MATFVPVHGVESRTGGMALRSLGGGRVFLPDDAGYDDARRGFNVSVDQHPAAVAYPESTTEVAQAVRVAADHGLRVAVWSTGHNAPPLGDLHNTLLLRTDRMRQVHVDPAARRVRAAAGARWGDVVSVVAPHGLSVLHGSSPTVGVAGYSLGGGIGWYARALGLAAHRVSAAEVVLANGTVVRASDSEHAELMWALRGAGTNVGIVTELEFEAFPFDTVYAGRLAWDLSQAATVFPAWAEWAAQAPREATTSLRIFALPPLEAIPAELRGRRLVIMDGAVLGDDPDTVLAPLRRLHPEIDSFARTPTSALTRLHMDPEEPGLPAVTDGLLVDDLPGEALDAFVHAAGPESGSSLLVAEIRQLGGALADPHPDHAALSHLPGRFLVFAAGLAVDEATGAAVERDAARVVDALRPWASGNTYLNFEERPCDASTAFTTRAWERLRRLRAAYDPHGVLRAVHPVTVPAESRNGRALR